MSLSVFNNKIKTAFVLLRVAVYRLFTKKPGVVIIFGISIGDDLLCTIVARQLKAKGIKNIWILSCFPELFLHNKDIAKVVKADATGHASIFMRRYWRACRVWIVHPWYTSYDAATDRDIIPSKHIIHLMCERATAPLPDVLKPVFILSEEEKQKGRLFQNQVCIQASGKGAKQHMTTKDWLPERYAEVVTALQQKYKVIQVGSKDDDLLPGVVDMRGKTTVREVAALLYHSNFFIGQVGFLMHLSRAVDCRSVIIYGGREKPEQSGYTENINLYAAVPCSPCWIWNACPNDKICMKEITAADLLNTIAKQLNESQKVARAGTI